MNKSQIIPKIREDVAIQIIEEKEGNKILLYDRSQIAPQPLLFPAEFSYILQYFDGTTTFEQLEERLSQHSDGEIDKFIDGFYRLVQELDYLCYLDTPYFESVRNDIIAYLNSSIRPNVCSNSSYSSNPAQLAYEIQTMLATAKNEKLNFKPQAIIVPHIDFRIGFPAHHVYSEAYNNIANLSYDIFVILGTSHYGNSDFFMFTKKDFETPLGIAQTEQKIIQELIKNYHPFELTFDDIAHRFEHSIEFQIVWLQYLFPKTKIKILPILVGSLHEFILNRQLPTQDDKIRTLFDTLRKTIFERYSNPLFIASVDFAHVGRKFNDPFDGLDIIDEVNNHDNALIKHIANCDANAFFAEVTKVGDKYKICGLSPIYSLLSIVQPTRGHFLSRDYWNDFENKSIVSFASFAFE